MALAKYLGNYAEPQLKQLASFPGRYDYSCVIPCHDENETFLHINNAAFQAACSLLIVVINETAAANTNANNIALYSFIEASFPVLWQSDDQVLTLFQYGDRSQLLCVDAFTAGHKLPARMGVGLARKIGADIACQLFHSGNVNSPWIFTTDADATLPHTYFTTADQHHDAAALLFPYRHTRPAHPGHALAMALYEFSLHYYASGLAWAGSPYAYQTVGSTLAIHAEHYAKVRGFPKRSAGEDFYLLNKLRKTGDIMSLPAPLIELSPRASNRTPFGTGAALRQIMQYKSPQRDYLFYHPKVFELLRELLQSLPDIWRKLNGQSPGGLKIRKALSEVLTNENLRKAFAMLDAETGIRHAVTQSKTLEGFLKHLQDWFDAFRTLKLVHVLRDNDYPSINVGELRRIAPAFMPSQP